MANQEVDTFATGGRTAGSGVPTVGTTITWWSPASNSDNWTAQAATSTFSFSGSQGQTTNSTTANVATLNGTIGGNNKTWYDSLVQANFQRTNTSDGTGVVARFQNINNYYRAFLNNASQLVITKVVGGTATVLGTPFSPTDGSQNANAHYTIKFLVQGFGLNGTVNNLQAKIWLVGTGEPAGYQVTATDASLTQVGLVGVYLKGNNAPNIQSVDTFSAVDPAQYTPAPTYATLSDLPYGMTNFVVTSNPPVTSQQTITDLSGIGNGAWIRNQLQWASIETAQGLYNWAILDDLVYRFNQAGIRIWQCLQGAPSFRLTRDGYGSNTTLTAQLTASTPYTSMSVAALPAGAHIPHGATLSVDFGGAHPETVTVNNPGATYTAGATTITINSFTPAFTHSIGAQIYESTGGPVLPSATDMATFAGLVAARYNGTAGNGKIEALQIENEAYDAQTRVGAQSASWDNGGAILAPVYAAAYTAIKSAYPGCLVVACAVRKTPNTALAHIQNWLTGLFAGVTAIDGVDAHYYRDSTTDWNGNPVPDPTLDTLVSSGGAVNTPSIQRELSTLKTYAALYGFSPSINIGEFGWLVYDDASGFTSATNTTITKNIAITTITVASLSQNIPDATPLFIDTGGANPEGPIYAWGTATASGTPVTIQITTNAAGHAQSQASWTPVFTHTSPVNVYAALGGIAQSQTQDMLYSKAMYDAGMANGASHMFRFTMSPVSSVTVGNVPQNVTGASGAPRSWTQTMSSVYTYMPGYYMTKMYAAQASTRFWTTLPTDGKDLTMTGTNTALTMIGLGTALTMTGYATNLTMTESNP